MTRKPPTGGPRIGPIWAGTISHVIALTSSAFETARNSTSRPIGTIMAPPIPCRMREATRAVRLLDRPHRIEPKVNKAIAEQNTVCEPNRSATLPLAGMNTARLSR